MYHPIRRLRLLTLLAPLSFAVAAAAAARVEMAPTNQTQMRLSVATLRQLTARCTSSWCSPA